MVGGDVLAVYTWTFDMTTAPIRVLSSKMGPNLRNPAHTTIHEIFYDGVDKFFIWIGEERWHYDAITNILVSQDLVDGTGAIVDLKFYQRFLTSFDLWLLNENDYVIKASNPIDTTTVYTHSISTSVADGAAFTIQKVINFKVVGNAWFVLA